MSCRPVQLVAVSLILAMCTSSIAEDRELHKLAFKLKKSLPTGWKMHMTRHHWILRREQPVALYIDINLPAVRENGLTLKEYVKDNVYHKEYVIVLRFGPKVSPKEYETQQAENRKAVKRYDEIARGVRDIAHKFDHYLPVNAEERKRVAEFKAAAAQIKRHQLPDYWHRHYSIYIETSQHWGEGFFEDEVGDECVRLQELSTAKFQEYNE